MAPQKILVIKLRALGDTILVSAPLRELTQAYPQAEIHLLIPKIWSELFEGIPGIHKIWAYERKNNKIARARSLARLAHLLRQEKYEMALNFHASPSSALIAFATGAKTRSIHFHGHHHRDRYSTVSIPGKGMIKPIIERDMDVLRALGLHVPAGRIPSISLQESEVQNAADFIGKLELGRPLLGISLGASRLTKQWPIERFVALAIEWTRAHKGPHQRSVLVFTGTNEEQLHKTFLATLDELLISEEPNVEKRSQIRKQIIALHDLPLRQFASLMSQLTVWAGNDSGPKHLAIAVNTPTVTLFGPEHPLEWHPYPLDTHPVFFEENLNCRRDAEPGMPPWCGLTECKIEENQCMKLIGVDRVLQECVRVAKIKSPDFL